MKQGLDLDLIEFLEWVLDEFHRGGRQDAAHRVEEVLSSLRREASNTAGRPVSGARLFQYVELTLRALELWRNW